MMKKGGKSMGMGFGAVVKYHELKDGTESYIHALDALKDYAAEEGKAAWLCNVLDAAKQMAKAAIAAAEAAIYPLELDDETIAELEAVEMERWGESWNGKEWVPDNVIWDDTDEQEGRRAQHGTDGSDKGVQ